MSKSSNPQPEKMMDGSNLEQAQAALAAVEGYEIRGKRHVAVKDRLDIFRRFFPYFSLSTRMEKHGTNFGSAIVIRAAISDETGREVASGYSEVVRGDGPAGTSAPLEFAETKAFGRALACFGLSGGEFASADELASLAVQAQPSGSKAPADGLSLDQAASDQEVREEPQLPANPTPDLHDDAGITLRDEVQENNGETSSGNRAWLEILKVLKVGLTLQQSSGELNSYYDSNKQLIYELKKFDKAMWDDLMDSFKNAKSKLQPEDLSI